MRVNQPRSSSRASEDLESVANRFSSVVRIKMFSRPNKSFSRATEMVPHSFDCLLHSCDWVAIRASEILNRTNGIFYEFNLLINPVC